MVVLVAGKLGVFQSGDGGDFLRPLPEFFFVFAPAISRWTWPRQCKDSLLVQPNGMSGCSWRHWIVACGSGMWAPSAAAL